MTMEPTDVSLSRKALPKNLAEFLDMMHGIGEAVPAPSPTAVRLATALAERLDALVPAPFRVHAEGGWVSRFNGGQWDGSAEVAGILDQDLSAERKDRWEPHDWPFVDRVVTISYNVLNSVQDMI